MAIAKHIGISKSRYTLYRQCPKALWLKTYKPEQAVISDALRQRFESGSVVGDLAKELFGNYTEVTAYAPDGKLNLSKMVEVTQRCIDAGVNVICEASFVYDGNYCAVDILKKENDGYAIYEVKSSTDSGNEVYAQDVAYQKYLLSRCGIEVTGTYLVCINSGYVLDGKLDIQKLFQVQDISEAVAHEYQKVGIQVAKAKKMLSQINVEPNEDIDVHCHKPYDCAFWHYCSRHLPNHSVFNLYRMNFDKKVAHYKQGIVNFEQLSNESLNDKRKHSLKYTL